MTYNEQIVADSNHVSLHGSSISEAMLREDLQLLNCEYMTTNSYIEIYPYNRNCVIKIDDYDSVKDNDQCINLFITGINPVNKDSDTRSLVVQHAMLVWLYLHARRLPFSIISVDISYSSRCLTYSEWIVISRYDFEQVYKKLPHILMDKDGYVRELSRLWIEGYSE